MTRLLFHSQSHYKDPVTGLHRLHAIEGQHDAPITALSICPAGRMLASGDHNGTLILWNIKSATLEYNHCATIHGPITSICWISSVALAFGCADGTVHIHEQKDLCHIADSDAFQPAFIITDHCEAIEDISYSVETRHIACVGVHFISLWRVDEGWTLTRIPTTEDPSEFVPRFVQFVDSGHSLVIGYMESHEVRTYAVQPWTLLSTVTTLHRIGHGCLSPDERSIATSNLHDGLDIYKVHGLTYSMTLKQKIVRNKPLQVAYGLSGAAIVSGSDAGQVPIYDGRDGRLLTRLPHSLSNGETALVRAITTFSSLENELVVTGSSDTYDESQNLYLAP